MAARYPTPCLAFRNPPRPTTSRKRSDASPKKYHPDQNKDDPKAKEKFAEANQAYEILGEEAKRKQFDRGEIDAEGKPRGFEGFPGGGFRPGLGRHGRPELEFELAAPAASARRRPASTPPTFFPNCSAADAAPGRAHGSGKRPATGGRGPSGLAVRYAGEAARGATRRVVMPTGKMLDCRYSRGDRGRQASQAEGEGNPSPSGGPAGDAIVMVKIAPHPLFQVEGRNLRVELPLTLYQAVLGGAVEAPTLTGRIELDLPAESVGQRAHPAPARQGLAAGGLAAGGRSARSA